MNKKDVADLIEDAFLRREPLLVVPLGAELVAASIEEMRAKLAKEFGVTHNTDHNGAWGRMGQERITLRFKSKSGHDIRVTMTIEQLSSAQADRADHYERRCPQ